MKKLKNIMMKIKSFKKFYKDEDETVFSGPGEEEAQIKGEIMRKKIPHQPGADKAPDIRNQPGPNYTNQPSLPKISYKRKSKVTQPGIRETDV